MSHLTDHILHLHGWVALVVIFLLPALESSAFVGFLFPGELALLLGGVLAFQHRISLPGAIAAGVLGAVIGDTVGYEVGKHVGRRLLDGTIGRFVNHEHLDRAEHYLAERGGKAVFIGRFTAALRVLIPGMAGMSGMPYRTFASYNITGGVIWATGFVVLGYAGGSSYRRVESVAKKASLVLLAFVVVVFVIVWLARRVARNPERIHALASRFAGLPLIAGIRSRYRRQLDFLLGRLRPQGTLGLSLTASLVLIAVAGWAFGTIVQDVLAGRASGAGLDLPLLKFFARHREPWLTTVAKDVTALGDARVLVPMIAVVGLIVGLRRRSWHPIARLVLAYAGAEVVLRVVRASVTRPRPPVNLAVAHFTGRSFPGAHAVVGVAVWGMAAAVVAVATPKWTIKVVVWTAAVLLAFAAPTARLYLGAQWLSDALGGATLGALWLFALLAALRTVALLLRVTSRPSTAASVASNRG